MTAKYSIVVMVLAGCDLLSPRVADPAALPDAAPTPDSPIPPPDGPAPFVHVLPAGTAVASIDTNAELLIQIRINDGLVDSALTASGGVVTRGTGKSAGATVRFWNFGPSPVEGTIAVAAPLYTFGTVDDQGVFTPLPDHPRLIDTVPGDTRYSPMRRVVNVPVTSLYAGERITSLEALTEALERGLVGDPVNDGTWVNMPVVLPGITLEVGPTGADPLASTQVYGRGYLVNVFELGTSLGRQPFRSGFLPIGQAAGLQTGVAAADGSLPTAIDAQPVFQFAIPTVAPAVFSYSPLAADVTVRLANGIAPSAVDADADLFKRNATGAITAFFPATVATFTIGTTVTNLQIQFAEGAP
ncbi:MAG: hypothetical protein H0V17_34980 [Deltaproteobacteria bacterium]|nr:hypothetical protein [Deltaproteobacteria bacterium]